MSLVSGNLQAPIAAVLVDPTSGLQYASPGVRKNRVALLGDSIVSRASTLNNLPTSVGSFVVSGGVGTLTFSGNVAIMVGNYFTLNNVADSGLSHPDNGRAFLCLSGSNASTWTNIVTFASYAAPSDYSSYASGFWAVNSHMSNLDSGLFTVLNAYARQQFLVTLNYGAVGELSANTLAKIPRILQGPPFDIAYLAVDAINDAQTFPTIAGAVAAANNYISCIQQLLSAGVVVIIQTGNPIRITTGGGYQANNQYMVIVRKIVLEYCKKNNRVFVYDALKEMLVGSVSAASDSYAASNSVGTFVYSADVHPTVNAYYTMAGNEPQLTNAAVGYPSIENELISILDDSVNFAQVGNPYLNLQQNGGMSGTSGTVTGTGASGTAATGWTLTATGTPTLCVGTGGYTPTQVGNTNSQNYAFAQRIQLTASAGSQGFTFKGPFNPAITPGWYQIGWRAYIEGAVGGASATAGLGAIYGNYNLGPGNVYMQSSGGDGIGYQLAVGAQLWYASGPIYFDRAPSIGQLFITGGSAAAGSFALQAMGAFCRPIDNPYV
jgi:hypothetical protein